MANAEAPHGCGAYMFIVKNGNGTESICGGCDHFRTAQCPHRFAIIGNDHNSNSSLYQTALQTASDALRRLRAECPGPKATS